MIDDPEKTDRLIAALKASLPVETRLSPALMATLRKLPITRFLIAVT